MSINWNVDAGSLLVSTLLTLIGIGLRRLYLMMSRVIRQHSVMYDDLDEHAGILNTHTTLMIRAGIVDGVSIPRAERRKHPRIVDPSLEGDLR